MIKENKKHLDVDNPDPVWFNTKKYSNLTTATKHSVKSGLSNYEKASEKLFQEINYPNYRPEVNFFMTRGIEKEPIILDECCEKNNIELNTSPLVINLDNCKYGVTADGLGIRKDKPMKPVILEAKHNKKLINNPHLLYLVQVVTQMKTWNIDEGLLIYNSHCGKRKTFRITDIDEMFKYVMGRVITYNNYKTSNVMFNERVLLKYKFKKYQRILNNKDKLKNVSVEKVNDYDDDPI